MNIFQNDGLEDTVTEENLVEFAKKKGFSSKLARELYNDVVEYANYEWAVMDFPRIKGFYVHTLKMKHLAWPNKIRWLELPNGEETIELLKKFLTFKKVKSPLLI